MSTNVIFAQELNTINLRTVFTSDIDTLFVEHPELFTQCDGGPCPRKRLEYQRIYERLSIEEKAYFDMVALNSNKSRYVLVTNDDLFGGDFRGDPLGTTTDIEQDRQRLDESRRQQHENDFKEFSSYFFKEYGENLEDFRLKTIPDPYNGGVREIREPTQEVFGMMVKNRMNELLTYAKSEFKLEYAKVEGMDDLQLLVKMRLVFPNTKTSTDWEFFSQSSLGVLNKEQKCELYETITSIDKTVKDTYQTCEDFIECLDSLTPDDTYLSVNELSMAGLMGYTDAINSGSIELAGDKLHETCVAGASEELENIVGTAYNPTQVEALDESMVIDIDIDYAYCPTIDFEEFERNYSEGYRGNLSFNFKLYLISKLINSSYAANGNRDYEALISQYSANSTDAINSLIGGADSLGDECDGPCLTSLMESKLREARGCVDKKAQEFLRLKKQIENDNSLDFSTQARLLAELSSEKSQYDREYGDVISLLERTRASGDRSELKELAAQNRADIALANANKQLEMEEVGEEYEEKAQRIIELEERQRGRLLTDAEKEKIREELRVTTQIFNTDTGEVTREETSLSDALGHSRAVESSRSEVSDSVINYSDIKSRGEREDQITRDIVERSIANGKEISEKDARRIARRLATSKSGIVNYENLGLVPKKTRRFNKNQNIAENNQAEQVREQASEIQNETANRIRRPAQVRQPGQYNTGFNNQNFSRNSSSSSGRSRGISAPTRAQFDPDASSDRYSARQRGRSEDVSSPVDSPIKRSGLDLGDGRGDSASRKRDVDIDVENNISSNLDDGSGVDIGDTSLDDSPVPNGGSEGPQGKVASRSGASRGRKSGGGGALGDGVGGTAGAAGGGSGSSVYNVISSIPTTYGEVVQSVADRGERELGNEIVQDYFNKYYSHSEGEIPVFREEMFIENSSDVVAFILANGLNGDDAIKSFYIAERGGGEGREKYNYINGKFVPESEGNITYRLKYSGGLNALIEFNL